MNREQWQPQVTLRPARPSDAATISAVWHDGWHDGHDGHVPVELQPHRTLDAFRSRTPGQLAGTTVAELDGAVVGFVTVHNDEIEQLYVARHARGGGVADVLIRHAERRINEGFSRAWLAVVAGNSRARRFYERNGWHDAGPVRYPAHAGTERIGVPSRRYEKHRLVNRPHESSLMVPPGLRHAESESDPTGRGGGDRPSWRASHGTMTPTLHGRVALVAGATRGAGRGIAVELGGAGATVYCTGRSTASQRSEMDRPETVEETAALVDAAGGHGIAVPVDHLEPDAVAALVGRIDDEHGALHVLVNDIWGATKMEWDATVWESDLQYGLHLLRLAIDSHAITCHFALPLLIREPGGLVVETTDGTAEYNAANYRVSFFYDLAKAANLRMAFSLAHELRPHGSTAVALTPGWLRSEAMLEAFGVTEESWRDATAHQPHFAISESPAFVGRAVVALAADPEVTRWSGQGLSSGQLAPIYGFTDVDGSQPDAWRYVPEVQDAGKPADVTGYR